MAPKSVISAAGKKRAINIEIEYGMSGHHYYPTARATDFVNQLATKSLQGGSAYSITGAFGVGKSSLGAFAMRALACKTKLLSPSNKKHPSLDQAVSEVRKRGGLLCVPVVGASLSLASCIARGFRNAAKNYIGPKPSALTKLAAANPEKISHSQLLDLLQKLSAQLHKKKKAGLVLIIDEFGRNLEHALANSDLRELHFLQNLAEATGQSEGSFSLIIIQHYGLEYYSRRILSEQRTEWDKVRGRFEEITLANSVPDTANIISKMLRNYPSRQKQDATAIAKKLAKSLSLHELADGDFLAALPNCKPLHPLTILLLSRLAITLGQSDRTIVGWLTSDLSTGFPAIAEQTKELIVPADLFEYFFGDLHQIPANAVLAKRYAALHSAYNRFSESSDKATQMLLKTISVVSFCSGGNLVANEKVLSACLPKRFPLRKSLSALEQKSLVIYRRHLDSYDVWGGSDYDIEASISNALAGNIFSATAELNLRASNHMLANAHFIKTGNHRIANITWLSKNEPAPIPIENSSPRVLIWLDAQPPKTQSGRDVDIAGTVNSKMLSGYLREAAAIRSLLDTDDALLTDVVAREELSNQLAYLQELMDERLDSFFDERQTWLVGGKKKFNALQPAISFAMDEAYHRALVLHNELINKTRVSGSITAALRQLVEAIVSNETQELLGITKFPAERMIYESLLRKTGVHQKADNANWSLSFSNIDNQLSGIIELIDNCAQSAVSQSPTAVKEIVAKLAEPPYGMKSMPARFLCAIFVYVNRIEVELYEEGRFLPNWGPQTLVRMLRSPDEFAMHLPTKHAYSKRLLTKYWQTIAKRKKAGIPSLNILARDLLLRYSKLSDYAQNTEGVSSRAIEFRRALRIANSPADMLFRTIPAALGIDQFPTKSDQLTKFFGQLNTVLAELEKADLALTRRFKQILLEHTRTSSIKAARQRLCKYAILVQRSSNMIHANKSFLDCILDESDSSDDTWLRNLLDKGLGVAAPIRIWTDFNVSTAETAFRRGLIGLWQVAGSLRKHKQIGDKMAVVVWPSLHSAAEGEEYTKLQDLVKKLPKKQAIAMLLNLVSTMSEA